MPSKKSTQPRAEWEDKHSTALAHRSEIYSHHTLQEVNDHGCDRIRSKLEKILGDLAVQHGLGKDIVKNAKAANGSSPKKRSKVEGEDGSPAKKKKVSKVELEEEE